MIRLTILFITYLLFTTINCDSCMYLAGNSHIYDNGQYWSIEVPIAGSVQQNLLGGYNNPTNIRISKAQILSYDPDTDTKGVYGNRVRMNYTEEFDNEQLCYLSSYTGLQDDLDVWISSRYSKQVTFWQEYTEQHIEKPILLSGCCYGRDGCPKD